MRAVAGQLTFEFERCRYTLEFDFAAIAFFERIADVSITDVAHALELQALGGPSVKVSHMMFLLQAGLQKHHAGLDLETAGKMLSDGGVQKAMDLAFSAAMPDAPAAEEDALGNGSGAVAGTGAGTKSSAPRSKRGSASKSSGRQRRARSG